MWTKHLHTPGIFIFHPEERMDPSLGTLPAAVLDAARIRRLPHPSIWTYRTLTSTGATVTAWTEQTEVAHRSCCFVYSAGVDSTREMERWKGRVALVTGASVGIGAAVARALVQQGMRVVGCARNVDKIEVGHLIWFNIIASSSRSRSDS